MHILRAIPAAAIIYGAFFYASNVLGTIRLNDLMTEEEKNKTGVSKLTDQQKQELETWLNQKFTLKTETPKQPDVYLSENINGGTQLRFSDGSLYELAPADRSRAQFWITPFLVKIEQSGDPNYPCKVTNTITGISVKAKQVEPPTK